MTTSTHLDPPVPPGATLRQATFDEAAPNALLRRLDGALVRPGDPEWDHARQAWNLAVDQQPAAVVQAAHARDVVAAVRHAAAVGARIAMQTTGHGAATLAPLRDVLLVRTTGLRNIEVDATSRRVRVGAGVLAQDLAAALATHGLTYPAGSSPDVGVAGYTLGGGIGWLGRAYGLACSHVVAAEVVTADGVLRRIDAEHDPELFWAIRGGGGAFAAVTALEFEALPLVEAQAGVLAWPIEQAPEVLHAWRMWTARLPDAVTSIARLLRYPPLPDLPPHVRGRQLVTVEAAALCDATEAASLLVPLRALQPEWDTFTTVPITALGQMHGDPEHPVPGLSDHRLLHALPADAVDALLALAGPGEDSALLAVDVRHLGGALGRPAPGGGALDHVDAGYALFAVGIPMTPEVGAAVGQNLATLRAGMAAWDAGREYLNFADQPVDAARLFPAGSYRRLREVKAAYDPADRFVSNHAIAPLA